MPTEKYLSADTEFTSVLLQEYLNLHRQKSRRYRTLWEAYENLYPVYRQPPKESYKPDNRMSVNFAKYITDTMNGYFIGIPIKITHPNKTVAEYLEYLDSYNNQDDNNAELSKLCDIFGHGYELLFRDEQSEIGITYLSPEECFIIYDDSILHRPLYGVRYYYDNNGILHGSFSDKENVYYFRSDNNYAFSEGEPHYFGDVPMIEYVENREKHGIFEDVLSLINAYNKAISEKANDVDYFADAYLKILGTSLDEESLKSLRNNRIINFAGYDTDKLIVEYLQKPNADTTQENLIERLEKLIFHISMVANISDESFGNASGISLEYKLQSMSNLAMTKERKFRAGMNKRYKMICASPGNSLKNDDWLDIDIKFTRNIPKNLLEESQIAGNLSGVTSQKTQLSVLSCVGNVDKEIEQIEKEQDKHSYSTDYPVERAVGESNL
ncbi:MAG: phage portal protein [Clostridia bacterium]|nr:phage portal protein [Clostridia bacterium]